MTEDLLLAALQRASRFTPRRVDRQFAKLSVKSFENQPPPPPTGRRRHNQLIEPWPHAPAPYGTKMPLKCTYHCCGTTVYHLPLIETPPPCYHTRTTYGSTNKSRTVSTVVRPQKTKLVVNKSQAFPLFIFLHSTFIPTAVVHGPGLATHSGVANFKPLLLLLVKVSPPNRV